MPHYTNSAVLVQDDLVTGNSDQGAPVKVYFHTLPATQVEAPLFSDAELTVSLSQPVLSNTFAQANPGRFDFYVADGHYDIVINESSGSPTFWTDTAIEDKDTFNLTEAEMIADKSLKVGDVVIVTDRGNGRFNIITGATGDLFGTIQLTGTVFQAKVDLNGPEILAVWFGVKLGDGNSGAIQAAIQAAKENSSGVRTVLLYNGEYGCHDITWEPSVTIKGTIPRGGTTLRYDGDKTGDDAILVARSGQSFGGLENISFLGIHSDGVTVSENLLVLDGILDLHMKIDNVGFLRCIGNAVHMLPTSQLVNLHMNRIRFDGVGGYGIRLVTLPTLESRPFSLSNWTYDNNNNAFPEPYKSEAEWGNGVYRLINGGHITFAVSTDITNARIELNKPINTTTNGDFTTGEVPSLFYFEHSVAAGQGSLSITMKNVTNTGLLPGQAVVHCDSGTLSGLLVNVGAPIDAFVYNEGFSNRSVKGFSLFEPLYPKVTARDRSLVRAHKGSISQIISTGSFQKVIWQAAPTIDQRNEFNNSTFTPNQPGTYVFMSELSFSSAVAGTKIQASIKKNGTNLSKGAPVVAHDTTSTGCSVMIIDFAKEGDTYEIFVFQDSGGDLTLQSNFDTCHVNITKSQ